MNTLATQEIFIDEHARAWVIAKDTSRSVEDDRFGIRTNVSSCEVGERIPLTEALATLVAKALHRYNPNGKDLGFMPNNPGYRKNGIMVDDRYRGGFTPYSASVPKWDGSIDPLLVVALDEKYGKGEWDWLGHTSQS